MNRIRTLVALATLGVVFATALAILQAGIPSRATAGEHQGPTWVTMDGVVEWYDASRADGGARVYAEVGEWADAYMAPVPWTGPQIPVNTTFYGVRLVEATTVELDREDTDLYIEGLWNITEVTYSLVPGDAPTEPIWKFVPIVEDGPGTLLVVGGWTEFTASIQRIVITGIVKDYHIRPSHPIPNGDISGPEPGIPDNAVNILDLVHAAKAYGSMPGTAHYDLRMDLDFDFIVDEDDLQAIAEGLGESY